MMPILGHRHPHYKLKIQSQKEIEPAAVSLPFPSSVPHVWKWLTGYEIKTIPLPQTPLFHIPHSPDAWENRWAV